jgi:hypothetical protein
MTPEQIREAMLDQLVEGRDLKRWRDDARQFLSDLCDATPREQWRLTLPVARHLLAKKGWQQKLTVEAVRDFCAPHLVICRTLALWQANPEKCAEYGLQDDLDPEATYMGGVVTDLQDRLWAAPTTPLDASTP